MTQMRVALVTGAARGIGRAIAVDLGRDHAVAATYHQTDPGALIRDCAHIHPIQCDLSSDQAAILAVQSIIKKFGRLDVIVNNAGVAEQSANDASDFTPHRYNFDVNVVAPMAIFSAALPHLTTGASVINISSVNAELPAKGAAAYSASKAALNTWTRAMAKEYGARGIRVNAIAPGAIEHAESPRPQELVDLFVENTALGRSGTPQDIASVVRFLASDASGFITGEVLTVSGGYRL